MSLILLLQGFTTTTRIHSTVMRKQTQSTWNLKARSEVSFKKCVLKMLEKGFDMFSFHHFLLKRDAYYKHFF